MIVAVIDIGSNSVRLRIYDHMHQIANHRDIVLLGKDLKTTGKLHNPENAITTLQNFKTIMDQQGVERCAVIATAAVRTATDGVKFINRVRDEAGLKIEIIDGDQEAELSAQAVIAAFPNANGLVMDLGGGSLELAQIENQKIIHRQTTKLGIHYLAENKKDYIEQQLSTVSWLAPAENIYGVGGTIKALARYEHYLNGQDFENVHGVQYTTITWKNYINRILSLDEIDIPAHQSKIGPAHIAALPHAARLMQILIQKTNPQNIIISDHGICEAVAARLTQE